MKRRMLKTMKRVSALCLSLVFMAGLFAVNVSAADPVVIGEHEFTSYWEKDHSTKRSTEKLSIIKDGTTITDDETEISNTSYTYATGNTEMGETAAEQALKIRSNGAPADGYEQKIYWTLNQPSTGVALDEVDSNLRLFRFPMAFDEERGDITVAGGTDSNGAFFDVMTLTAAESEAFFPESKKYYTMDLLFTIDQYDAATQSYAVKLELYVDDVLKKTETLTEKIKFTSKNSAYHLNAVRLAFAPGATTGRDDNGIYNPMTTYIGTMYVGYKTLAAPEKALFSTDYSKVPGTGYVTAAISGTEVTEPVIAAAKHGKGSSLQLDTDTQAAVTANPVKQYTLSPGAFGDAKKLVTTLYMAFDGANEQVQIKSSKNGYGTYTLKSKTSVDTFFGTEAKWYRIDVVATSESWELYIDGTQKLSYSASTAVTDPGTIGFNFYSTATTTDGTVYPQASSLYIDDVTIMAYNTEDTAAAATIAPVPELTAVSEVFEVDGLSVKTSNPNATVADLKAGITGYTSLVVVDETGAEAQENDTIVGKYVKLNDAYYTTAVTTFTVEDERVFARYNFSDLTTTVFGGNGGLGTVSCPSSNRTKIGWTPMPAAAGAYVPSLAGKTSEDAAALITKPADTTWDSERMQVIYHDNLTEHIDYTFTGDVTYAFSLYLTGDMEGLRLSAKTGNEDYTVNDAGVVEEDAWTSYKTTILTDFAVISGKTDGASSVLGKDEWIRLALKFHIGDGAATDKACDIYVNGVKVKTVEGLINDPTLLNRLDISAYFDVESYNTQTGSIGLDDFIVYEDKENNPYDPAAVLPTLTSDTAVVSNVTNNIYGNGDDVAAATGYEKCTVDRTKKAIVAVDAANYLYNYYTAVDAAEDKFSLAWNNGKLAAEAYLPNASAQSAVCILAEYTDDHALASCATRPLTLDGETVLYTAEYTPSGNDNTYKAFLWNTMSDMTPLGLDNAFLAD